MRGIQTVQTDLACLKCNCGSAQVVGGFLKKKKSSWLTVYL